MDRIASGKISRIKISDINDETIGTVSFNFFKRKGAKVQSGKERKEKGKSSSFLLYS